MKKLFFLGLEEELIKELKRESIDTGISVQEYIESLILNDRENKNKQKGNIDKWANCY